MTLGRCPLSVFCSRAVEPNNPQSITSCGGAVGGSVVAGKVAPSGCSAAEVVCGCSVEVGDVICALKIELGCLELGVQGFRSSC